MTPTQSRTQRIAAAIHHFGGSATIDDIMRRTSLSRMIIKVRLEERYPKDDPKHFKQMPYRDRMGIRWGLTEIGLELATRVIMPALDPIKPPPQKVKVVRQLGICRRCPRPSGEFRTCEACRAKSTQRSKEYRNSTLSGEER